MRLSFYSADWVTRREAQASAPGADNFSVGGMKQIQMKTQLSGRAAALAVSSDVLARYEVAPQLYGRSRENHAVLAAFKRAVTGSAEMIVLSGPAGIGKTSLVQQMRCPIAQQHGY